MNRKILKSVPVFLSIVLVISLIACNPATKYEKDEKNAITAYLNSDTSKHFIKESSGMYYLETLLGTGRQPVIHDTATVIYTGKFLNGTVFDTNVGGTKLVFPVDEGQMIPGFEEGISYMKEGGKATFLIPSSLAYGTQGYYTVPGYTPLLYDVELVKVAAGPGK